MIEPLRDGPVRRRASPWARVLGSIWLCGSAIAGAGLGCRHQPEPCLLELAEGDVVITELRGPQDGTWGEWIELYNATDETLDLYGLRGTLEPLSGSGVDGEAELTFLVRESLPVDPGGYVVLGTLPLHPTRLPAVDYSINTDFRLEPTLTEETGGIVVIPEDEDADPKALFGSARLRLHACETLIDSFSYVGLPAEGTLGYDGARTPDADDNDDRCARWCTDVVSPPDPEWTGATGIPGTPGRPNLPCDAEPEC